MVRQAHHERGETLRALLEQLRKPLGLQGELPGSWKSPRGAPTAGFFNPVHPSTVQVLGAAAAAWLAGRSPAERAALPATLRRRGVAVTIVAAGGAGSDPGAPEWSRAGIAVLRSRRPAHDLVYRLRRRLAEQGAARATLHGVLLRVHGQGVLITGPAGAGKGRLALELVRRGHVLVADDAVDVRRPAGGVLVGGCPPLLRGCLEVRGLGVLDVRRLFGARAVRESQRIDLVVRLVAAPRALRPEERLGGRRAARRVLGVALPSREVPAKVGDNQATLVEAACLDEAARDAGVQAGADLAARQLSAIRGTRP